MQKPRVAIFGLGLMGSGMARRLLGAGFDLTVYNRNAEKAAPFAEAGAKVANSPHEAALNADVIISMVADDGASRGLWLGEDGALEGAKPGTVIIESSTLTVGWVKELAAAAAEKGCVLLDAPVTGSKPQAASGELSFIVGGPSETLELVRPVLEVMSRAIIHLGPTGSGATLKLINNFLCGVQAVSLAEGLSLIEKSGLDRTKSLEILTNGAPGSPLIKALSARMTAQDYSPNFMLRLMAKDLTYAIEQGKEHGLEMLTATAAKALFNQGIDAGHGSKDLSAVIESLRGN